MHWIHWAVARRRRACNSNPPPRGPHEENAIVEIRKLITTRETIFSELGVTAPRPVVRAVGTAVILRPLSPGAMSTTSGRSSKQE
jgi:hypothetical protein